MQDTADLSSDEMEKLVTDLAETLLSLHRFNPRVRRQIADRLRDLAKLYLETNNAAGLMLAGVIEFVEADPAREHRSRRD